MPFRLRKPDLGPLHEIDFRRYALGQTLSGFGDSLVPLALSFAVLDLTHSVTALGLVLLASRVPITVFTLLGGVIGDRLRRRDVMIAADLVRLVVHAATAALLLSGHARLWHLVVLQAVAGTAAAFFNPAASGLVRSVVSREHLQAANALLGLSRNTLGLFALAVSGTLVATAGAGWAFALNAATFAISVWFLARLRLAGDEWAPVRASVARQLVEGFDYVRSRTWLVVMVAHGALLNAVVIAPLMVLGPDVAKKHLGGAGGWAAIGIALACGAICGSAIALRFRPRRPLAAPLGAVLGAVPLTILLAVAPPIWVVLPAALLFGIQSSFSNATIAALIQTHVPAAAISRVSSYESFGSLVLAPLGFAAAGIAADAFGTPRVLWFAAAWVVVSTLGALCFPEVRELGATVPASETSRDPVAEVA